jgi:hypothetical protein
MKNKLVVCFALVGLMLFLTRNASAASDRGGAVVGTALNYTTNVVAVSTGSAALYQVVLGSGAASEFVVLFDSGAATGLSSGLTNSTFKARLFFATTSSNTVVTFDPPLQFNNGIMAIDSANTGQALFLYQKGRVPGN